MEQYWPGPEDEPYEMFDEAQPYPENQPWVESLGTGIHQFIAYFTGRQSGRNHIGAFIDEMIHVDPAPLTLLFEEPEQEEVLVPDRTKLTYGPGFQQRPILDMTPLASRSSKTPWVGHYRRTR